MNYFYGNTINPSQFQFDKIYPNRKEMDENCSNDGVFIGRYILIKYDTNKEISRIYIGNEKENGKFYGYTSKNKEERTKIIFNEQLESNFYYDFDETGKQIFYKAIKDEESKYALFESLYLTSEELSKEEYFQNLNIDKKTYGLEKISYDATVWQKSYIDEGEQYIKIADLNSGIPIFDLAIDPPTSWPLAPHFEANSIEDAYQRYYRLHVQPNWGFRIAEANSEDLSDEGIVWIREIYEKNTDTIKKQYYDIISKEWKEYNSGNAQISKIPGAIYYNKDGFKKEKQNYKNINDSISMEPGKSGTKYEHHSGTPIEQNDIQELKILLPSLGNAISDIWDIIYGEERNLDIDWNSLQGLRLSTTPDGYQYSTKSINTIAGCINSVHDLMGMIIVEQPEDVQYANENNIYWNGEFFSRKKKNYNYQEIKKNDDYIIIKVEDPQNNYFPNTYYLDENGEIKDTENKYNPNNNYYQKLLKTNYIQVVNMKNFEKSKYFYFIQNNFILENNDIWNKDFDYFEILDNNDFKNATIESFKTNYQENSFYYEFEENVWKKEESLIPRKDCEYYDFSFIPEETGEVPFGKGLWQHNKETQKFEELQDDSVFNKENLYYIQEVDEITGDILFNKVIPFELTENHRQIDENGIVYYDKDRDKNYPYPYYIQEVKGIYKNTDFYLPNLYHKKVDGSYILNVDPILEDLNLTHYAFLQNEYIENHKPQNFIISCTFFEPDVYFINSKTISGLKEYAEVYDPNETYYKYGEEFYVLKDERNSMARGALWNNQVSLIPWPIVLARREVKYEFEELVGFAKSYNTIHGLLLKLNYLLEANDNFTRDTQTVQGALNKLNDIFYRFEQIIPNTILSIGINGKIYSTRYESDNWINYDLDNVSHKLKISHNDIPHRNDLEDLMTIELDLTKPIIITYDRKGHIHNIINK